MAFNPQASYGLMADTSPQIYGQGGLFYLGNGTQVTDPTQYIFTQRGEAASTTNIAAVVSPSGDTTGTLDTGALNTALAAAATPYGSMIPLGPTASGNIVALRPGVYTINAPLKIGSFTTIDARGSVINLAAGSNCNMLTNLGSTAVITSTGSIGAAGSVMSFQTGASDPIYQQLLLMNPNTNSSNPPIQWGASITIPNSYAGNGFTYSTALYIGNVQYLNSFNQAQLDTTAPSTSSNLQLKLYYRDTTIRVIGGVWNYGANGSGGNNFADHTFRFFCADGITLEGCTFLSHGNNGLYGVSIVACTNYDIGPLYFDVNTGSWTWTPSHLAGFARDGVHIGGPSRDGRVFALRGSTGDDLAAITTGDFGNIAGFVTGNVSNVSFEDIRCGFSNQGLVKVIAGPGTSVTNVTVKKVTGTAAVALYIGDDNRNVATEGGTIDGLICEDVNCTGESTSSPLINIAGLGMGVIKVKNSRLSQFAGSTVNLIEVGYQPAAANTTPTVVADLSIDGLNVASLVGGRKTLNIRSSATISQLRYRDWDLPLTNYPLIANAGTVSAVYSNDVLAPVSLTAQTATIGATTAFTTPTGLAGLYRITVDLITTSAGSAGTATASIATNNGSGAKTQTTGVLDLTTLGAEVATVFEATLGGGQTITYSTTVAAAVGAPQYSLSIRCEFLG